MDLAKIDKLSVEIEQKSYATSQAKSNQIYRVASLFGNAAAIIFEFFFLYSIVVEVMPDFKGVGVVSGVLLAAGLTLFEFIKRLALRGSFLLIIKKEMSLGKFPSLLFAILLVVASAWMGINGAQKFSDQEEEITQSSESVYELYRDSLTSIYMPKIELVEQQLATKQEKLLGYNQLHVSKRGWLIRQEMNKLDEQVVSDRQQAERLRQELEEKLATHQAKLELKKEQEVVSSDENSLAFTFIIAFVELIIIVGIGFNALYDYRYFHEMSNSEDYRTLKLYLQLLAVLYNRGKVMVGDRIPSYAKLRERANQNKIAVSEKEVKSFVSFSVDQGILKGSTVKRFQIDFEQAKELILTFYETKS